MLSSFSIHGHIEKDEFNVCVCQKFCPITYDIGAELIICRVISIASYERPNSAMINIQNLCQDIQKKCLFRVNSIVFCCVFCQADKRASRLCAHFLPPPMQNALDNDKKGDSQCISTMPSNERNYSPRPPQ